jgi:hypothetical protein
LVLKSQLKSTIREVLEQHDIVDENLLDDIVDRLQIDAEVVNDDEESEEEEKAEPLLSDVG